MKLTHKKSTSWNDKIKNNYGAEKSCLTWILECEHASTCGKNSVYMYHCIILWIVTYKSGLQPLHPETKLLLSLQGAPSKVLSDSPIWQWQSHHSSPIQFQQSPYLIENPWCSTTIVYPNRGITFSIYLIGHLLLGTPELLQQRLGLNLLLLQKALLLCQQLHDLSSLPWGLRCLGSEGEGGMSTRHI